MYTNIYEFVKIQHLFLIVIILIAINGGRSFELPGRFGLALSKAKWETETLRNDIKKAVAQDYYAVPPEGHEKATDNFLFRPLFGQRGKLFDMSKVRSSHGSEAVGAVNAETGDFEFEEDLNVHTNLIDVQNIYSKTGVQETKCKNAMNLYRDILTIESIKEDVTLSFGAEVVAWKTLSLQKHKTALVGLTDNTIVLAVHSADKFELVKELQLNGRPIDFAVFKHWTIADFQGFVAVNIDQNIVFLRIDHNASEMEVFWTWTMYKNITGLHGFSIDSFDMLAVLSASDATQRSTVVDIYNFNLDSKEFWIQQQIRLDVFTTQMAHLESSNEHFICFPQSNQVRIYAHRFKWFEHHVDIPANNAQTISTFRMGSQSYLAIGGDAPYILRYVRGSFHSQSILDKSWGTVDFFLAVDARTYRDDLILFVQHQIDFESHKLTVLDALVWNGEAFDTDLSTPCYIFGALNNHGLSCVLDPEHATGIYGTAVLRTEDKLQILVPRFKVAPAVFDIEMKLKPTFREQAEEEIFELYREVNDMFEDEREMLHLTKMFFNEIDSNEIMATEGFFEQLNTIDLDIAESDQQNIVLHQQNGVDNFTIGELKEFLQTLSETKEMLEQELEQRAKRQTEPKTEYARSVIVNNLEVEFVNGIPVKDLYIGSNRHLKLDGTLVVANGSIEAQNVERNIETTATIKSADGSEIVQIPFLHSENNFEVDVINGVPWNEFIQDIVFLNNHDGIILNNLNVDGDVLFFEESFIENLNNWPYPDDYVWSKNSTENIISGTKTFAHVLMANAIDMELGTINGFNPSSLISINTTIPQSIPKLTTFRRLEVTVELDIHGKVIGNHFNDFTPNPSLQQSLSIPAACFFNDIIVEGPIFIQNEFNNVHFDGALSRVLYNAPDNREITALKRFRTIEGPIIATSELINHKGINQYFTTNTFQQFNMPSFCGNIIFQNLHVGGLFDFINITELEQNTIKLSGEQYTEMNIAFQGADGAPIKIYANQLQVMQTINNIDVQGFKTINDNFEIPKNFIVDNLDATKVILDGELWQNGQTLFGWNLIEFESLALMQKKNQRIQQPVYIKKAIIKKNKGVNQINGYALTNILERLASDKSNHDYMIDPKVHVERMVVEGSVQFDYLNDFHVDTIERSAIYLNQPQTFYGSLRFLDDVIVNGNLSVKYLFDKEFDEFVSNMVYRDENYIIIKGDTVFTKDIHIVESLEPQFTDGFETKRILSKHSDHIIKNPLKIYGNITVSGLNCNGYINSIDCKKISQMYQYDAVRNAHVITADVYFDTIQTRDLHMNSGLNDIKNVRDYLVDVVRKDRQSIVKGRKHFKEFVHFDTNLKLLTHRGVDIPKFLDTMVLIDTDKVVSIDADVYFMDKVEASSIMIKGDLFLGTNTIVDVDFDEWIANSISLSQAQNFSSKFMFGTGVVSTSSATFNVHNINGKPLANLITLHTQQHFPGHTRLGQVDSYVPIQVDGHVNAINLTEEQENTLMISGNQVVMTPLIFSQPVRVLFRMDTSGKINEYNFVPIWIDRDVALQGPLSIYNVTARNLVSNSILSGINFTEWSNQILRTRSDTTQVVTGPWTVEKARISSLGGNGWINNQPVAAFLRQFKDNHQQLRAMTNDLNDTYRASCAELHSYMDVVNDVSRFAVALEYFDFDFRLAHSRMVRSLHSFEKQSIKYLLINSGCHSSLRIWNTTTGIFDDLATFETGAIDTWIHIFKSPETVYLITNGKKDQSCSRSGVHIWTLNLANLEIVNSISLPYNCLSIQQKWNSSNSFYALRSDDWKVIEYDLSGNIREEWIVFKKALRTPRFIPNEGNMGLVVTDGSTLSLLASSRTEIKKRAINLDDTEFNPITDCDTGSKQKRCTMLPNGPLLRRENPGRLTKCKLQQQFNKLFANSIPKFKWNLARNANTASASNVEQISNSEKKLIAAGINSVPSVETTVKPPTTIQSSYSSQNMSNKSSESQVGATAGNVGQIVVNIIQLVGDILSDDFDFDENNVELRNIKGGEDLSSLKLNSNTLSHHIQLIAERIVDRIWDALWNLNGYENNNHSAKPINSQTNRLLYKNDSDIKPEDIRMAEQIMQAASQIMSQRINSTILQNRTCENASSSLSSSVVPVVGDYFGELQDAGIAVADRIANRILEEIQENNQSGADDEDVGDAFGELEEEAKKFADFLTDGIAQNIQQDREDGDDTDSLASAGQTNINNNTIQNDVNKLVNIAKRLERLVRKLQRKAMIEKENKQTNDAENRSGSEGTKLTNSVETLKKGWSFDKSNQSIIGDSIGKAITPRIINAENTFLPAHGQGEIVLLKVKQSDRILYAVTHQKDKVDNIVIYKDIIEGKIYQNIQSFKPRSIIGFSIGADTFLAFLEAEYTVKIYVYGGISGFKEFYTFKLPTAVSSLNHIEVQVSSNAFICKTNYLLLAIANEVQFMKGHGKDNCHINRNIKC